MTPRGEVQAQGCLRAEPEPLGTTRARRQEQPPKRGLGPGHGLTSHQPGQRCLLSPQRPAAPAPPGGTAPHSPHECPAFPAAKTELTEPVHGAFLAGPRSSLADERKGEPGGNETLLREDKLPSPPTCPDSTVHDSVDGK